MKELFGTLEELIHHARETPGQLLFRGQPSARFDLRPSIGRPHPRYKPNARIEKNLLEQFRLKSRAYRSAEASKLDSLILARHYGLNIKFQKMKVTVNWLKQYIDFNWSPEELTERLAPAAASTPSASYTKTTCGS